MAGVGELRRGTGHKLSNASEGGGITLRGEMSTVPILPGTTDERLCELVRSGEERAFEMVVRRYRASLVGYCMRLGLSESRAEDAVQQCFLSALLALRRGDDVRDLRAWLGRIAHNVAVNLMRAGSVRREMALGVDGEIDERAIHIPDMEGGIAARAALAEVAALPAMQREALLQSALGGRSYGEVALSMGVSEGAVRGLLHRARLTLRSAAAIFSPLPLMRRASGWLGGGSPSAGRVMELTAPGASSGISSTAVRAIGAGLTAIVVAAGVAVAPIHGGSRHRTQATAQAGGAGAAAIAVPAAARGATAATSPATATPATTTGRSAGGAPAGSSTGVREVQVLGTPGAARSSDPRPATVLPSGSQVTVLSTSSPSGPAQASSLSPAGGSGTATPTTPPAANESPGETGKSPTGEKSESVKDGGHSEQSELAEETREREAEAAAEKAEREREEAAAKAGKGR